MNDGEYQLTKEQVELECEPRIHAKLELLQQWLYGSQSEIRFRMAPSLIVRSEAELFGISSPRFAIRAYVSEHGFVNIRRKTVFEKMIRSTFREQAICDQLLGSFKGTYHVWIADSLLETPPRLTSRANEKENYSFLKVPLSREYGEASDKELSPFVTYISIGGGLCAQAACFLALCFAKSENIYGISEITKLVTTQDHPNSASIRIHGMNPETMTRFFVKSVEDAEAQLQSIPQFEVEGKVRRFYWNALKTYIRNGIPVICFVSSSRMKGVGLVKRHQKPIITLKNLDFNADDHSEIPIGRAVDPSKLKKDGTYRGATVGIDNHCVVIVGVNDDYSFCIHDPATFPFLEASIDQLLDAGAHADFEGKKREETHDPFARPNTASLQFVAVTPKGVEIPLLDFTKSLNKVLPDLGDTEDFNLEGVLKVAIDNQQARETRPDPQFGDFFLVQHVESTTCPIESRREGLPELAATLLQGLPLGWYWLQLLEHPIAPGKLVPTLWFWAAGELVESREEAILVLAKVKPNDDNSWEVRPDLI